LQDAFSPLPAGGASGPISGYQIVTATGTDTFDADSSFREVSFLAVCPGKMAM
jgi:hypothetical protein